MLTLHGGLWPGKIRSWVTMKTVFNGQKVQLVGLVRRDSYQFSLLATFPVFGGVCIDTRFMVGTITCLAYSSVAKFAWGKHVWWKPGSISCVENNLYPQWFYECEAIRVRAIVPGVCLQLLVASEKLNVYFDSMLKCCSLALCLRHRGCFSERFLFLFHGAGLNDVQTGRLSARWECRSAHRYEKNLTLSNHFRLITLLRCSWLFLWCGRAERCNRT
jgi:hypothetical protein